MRRVSRACLRNALFSFSLQTNNSLQSSISVTKAASTPISSNKSNKLLTSLAVLARGNTIQSPLIDLINPANAAKSPELLII